MVKRLVLLVIILLIAQYSYALDVVYPKQKSVTINSPSTFFIGSSDYSKKLTINGLEIDVHQSGGFAQSVPLSVGENTFTLKSGEETLVYKITRPAPPAPQTETDRNVFKPYNEKRYYKVISDNTPLRSTPVDEGINRLAHLQAGTPLIVDGEKNEFYRVMLGLDNYGWISKSHAEVNNTDIRDVRFNGANIDADAEFFIYTFYLSAMTTWSIEENNETLDISIYNISNSDNNKFTIKIPVKTIMNGKNLLGYSASFSGNNFVVKIRKPLEIEDEYPLYGVKIAIDAGHGGTEIGAIGCLGDLEKNITLQYSKELAAELRSRGADVIMIRDRDEYIGLRERVDKTNRENAVIFISLHGNALPDYLNPIKNRGTEIYYYYPQAKPLADSIMNSMVTETDTVNHGIIQRSFAVVRNTNALSLLIEIGYLINSTDNANILDANFRKNTVKAISDGIENYLRSQL